MKLAKLLLAAASFLALSCAIARADDDFSGPPPPAAAALPAGPNGYVVGNWYAENGSTAYSAGVQPGAGSMRCYPGYFNRTWTSDSIGVRISTLFAGGNIQGAVYANSAANRPTGNKLVSSASMSTAVVTGVSAAAAFQFQAYTIYWFCSNMDNTTSIAVSATQTSVSYEQLLGDPSLGNMVTGSGAGVVGVSTPKTFGTWDDVSGATWTVVFTASFPLLMPRIASIP